jgi:hypothetical protein
MACKESRERKNERMKEKKEERRKKRGEAEFLLPPAYNLIPIFQIPTPYRNPP